jgi:hypothetical protein
VRHRNVATIATTRAGGDKKHPWGRGWPLRQSQSPLYSRCAADECIVDCTHDNACMPTDWRIYLFASSTKSWPAMRILHCQRSPMSPGPCQPLLPPPGGYGGCAPSHGMPLGRCGWAWIRRRPHLAWTRMTLLWEGEEYVLGSAGSLVLCCPTCGAERFRDPGSSFAYPTLYAGLPPGSALVQPRRIWYKAARRTALFCHRDGAQLFLLGESHELAAAPSQSPGPGIRRKLKRTEGRTR